MTGIFDAEATKKHVKQLPDLPPEEVGIGVTATTAGDIGIEGHANKDLGRPGGWFVLAEGSWMRKAGGTLTTWLGWKPK